MTRKASIIYFGFFILFLALVPLLIVLLPKGKAFYHIVVAQKMLKEGNVDGALAQVKTALAIQPQNAFAIRNAANVYMIGGMHEEAEHVLKVLLAMSPENADVYRDLGLIRLYDQDVEGAREAAKKAVLLAPETANTYHLLGAIAFKEKDLKAAENHLLKAISMDPKHINSHFLLGSIYSDQDRMPEAVEKLSVVTASDPGFAPAHSLIGTCYLKMNLHLHALAAFKHAVDLNPADYNSMYNIACIYSLEDKPQPALKWLERAVEYGFADFEHMKQDGDLDNIRSHPDYLRLLQRASPKETPLPQGTDATTKHARVIGG